MKFHWPLYSDIIFFVDHYNAGVSNKHWLLLFFHWYFFSLRNMPMHYAMVFKGCKNYNFETKIVICFSLFCSKHRSRIHVRTEPY